MSWIFFPPQPHLLLESWCLGFFLLSSISLDVLDLLNLILSGES